MAATTSEDAAPAGAEFRRLFDRYHRPILAFFRRRGIPLEEAREMTQETFLAAFTGYHRFRADSARGTWLFGIAKNVWRRSARDAAREKRRAVLVPIGGGVGERPEESIEDGRNDADPEVRTLGSEAMERVERGLAELPELDRQCLALRVDGHSYREIATILRVEVKMVKSRLHEGREKLRRHLEGDIHPAAGSVE